MSYAQGHLLFLGVLSVYCGLSLLFHRATPPLEASDEAGHAAFIFHLQQHRALPLCIPGQPLGPGPQEFTQAPLYYVLGALLIAPIDTANAGEFFVPRPGAPIGRADLAGPKNGWELRGNRAFPYTQTRLAIVLLRLFSLGLGCLTLGIIYGMTRRIWPGQPLVHFSALAWVAFNPMFLFISNSINNDNLVILGSTATLAMLFAARKPGAGGRTDFWAGGLLGLSILAKVSGCLLVPVACLGYAGAARSAFGRVRGLIICLMTASFIAGPWLIWNQVHYGDPLGLGIHCAFAHLRSQPNPWALVLEWDGFIKSYWGVFGLFNVIYPTWVYNCFYGITLLALGGIIWVFIARRWGGWEPLMWGVFSLLVLASVAYWTRTVWASQGRLLFPALGAHALLIAGTVQATPVFIRRNLVLGISVFLTAIAFWAAVWIIPRAYI